MNPLLLKYRLWRLALRMNPQPGTLNARAASLSIGTPDSFPASYNLLRLTYKPPKLEQLRFANAVAGTQYGVWTILTADLDQAGAPPPAITWTLVIGGQTWLIENIDITAMQQAYECLCRLAPG